MRHHRLVTRIVQAFKRKVSFPNSHFDVGVSFLIVKISVEVMNIFIKHSYHNAGIFVNPIKKNAFSTKLIKNLTQNSYKKRFSSIFFSFFGLDTGGGLF
jgi:hypothetical protein